MVLAEAHNTKRDPYELVRNNEDCQRNEDMYAGGSNVIHLCDKGSDGLQNK